MARTTIRDFGTALSFNGTSARVNPPDSVTTHISGTSPFSLSIWYKQINTGQGNGRMFFFWGNTAGTGAQVLFSSIDTTTKLQADFGNRQLNGTNPHAINEWHQAVMTWDGTTRILYCDGSVDGTDTPTSVNVSAANNAPVIGSRDSTNFNFQGNLDEPTLWSRALTLAEVQALYFNGIVPSSGLVYRYLFNEATGTSATDSSGNGNTGTITAATYTGDVPMKRRLVARDFGTALNLTGANTSYADVPAASLTAFSGQSTIAFWVKLKSKYVSGNSYVLIDNAWSLTAPNLGGWQIYIGNANNAVNIVIGDASNQDTLTTGASFFTPSQWQRCVITKNASTTTIKAYLDGVLINSKTNCTAGTTQPISGNLTFGINRIHDSGTPCLMDTIEIYNTEFTQADVTSDFYYGTTTETPLHRWLFNEGTGTSVADSVGTATATLAAAASFTPDVVTRSRS